MEYSKLLKTLVWLNLILLIFELALFAGEYITTQSGMENCETLPAVDIKFVLVIYVISALCQVIGFYGIYKLKNYGRIFLLVSSIVFFIALIVDGSSVYTGLAQFIDTLITLFMGALIAMCWLPPEANHTFIKVTDK